MIGIEEMPFKPSPWSACRSWLISIDSMMEYRSKMKLNNLRIRAAESVGYYGSLWAAAHVRKKN